MADYEATNNSNDNYATMEDIINDTGADGIQVLNWLTDWHGLDLLDEDFMQNLIDCEL